MKKIKTMVPTKQQNAGKNLFQELLPILILHSCFCLEGIREIFNLLFGWYGTRTIGHGVDPQVFESYDQVDSCSMGENKNLFLSFFFFGLRSSFPF